MSTHRKARRGIVARMSRKQAIATVSALAAAALLIGGGVGASHLYRSSSAAASQSVSAYSATDANIIVSRNSVRQAIDNGANGVTQGTSYVKVVINGQPELVFGSDFTDVKSVLQQGGITLGPNDTISPSLTTKVKESTVITINRANTTVETVTTKIPFNTIIKQTDSLPKGQTKVQTEGQDGIMEATNLVQKSGANTISTNTLTSWVKTAPVNKVILEGTGTVSAPAASAPSSSSQSSSSSSSSNNNSAAASAANQGTTMPVGQAQALAHQLVLARGWDEGQFTCLVKLWQRESGWSVTAHNPSGAYGIPQALPGSKMGPGWQSDANVQINWGINYIAGRYGTPCGAWAHSNATGWY